MGLDITAYRNLKMIENPILDDEGYPENWENEIKFGSSLEWSESCFPGRGEGVEHDKVYTYDEEFCFKAGSYTGYGIWRDKLQEFKGEVAFQELIDFADNEGVIGSIVSKKLKDDFSKYKDDAKQFSESLNDNMKDWWFNQYCSWEKAFDIASDCGAVNFH